MRCHKNDVKKFGERKPGTISYLSLFTVSKYDNELFIDMFTVIFIYFRTKTCSIKTSSVDQR